MYHLSMRFRLIILLLITVIGIYLYQIHKAPVHPTDISIKDHESFRLTGVIKDIDDSCNHDGICRIRVENIWIVTNLGGDPSPEMVEQRTIGKIFLVGGQEAFNIPKDYVNKKVDVYAKKIDETTATLYGTSEYYIKAVE